MILQPYNVSTVTAAVESQLRGSALLKDARIERSDEINEDPAQCPWIGIYRLGIKYPSRTLGVSAGYRQQRIDLLLLVQDSNGESGRSCEQALEGLAQKVLSILLSDPTLNGVVATLDEIEVRYPDYQRTADNQFMQTAAIYITAIGGIQVT